MYSEHVGLSMCSEQVELMSMCSEQVELMGMCSKHVGTEHVQ